MILPFSPRKPRPEPQRPSILAVANHLIRLGDLRDAPAPRSMDHLRIQKLACLAYGHHLVETDVVLCLETPELWPQGPGFIDLFMALQYSRGDAIERYIKTPFDTPHLDDHPLTRECLRWVEARYAPYDTLELAGFCQAPDSAWYRAATEVDFRCARGTAIAAKHFRASVARIA